jgi:hypothetical protein
MEIKHKAKRLRTEAWKQVLAAFPIYPVEVQKHSREMDIEISDLHHRKVPWLPIPSLNNKQF